MYSSCFNLLMYNLQRIKQCIMFIYRHELYCWILNHCKAHARLPPSRLDVVLPPHVIGGFLTWGIRKKQTQLFFFRRSAPQKSAAEQAGGTHTVQQRLMERRSVSDTALTGLTPDADRTINFFWIIIVKRRKVAEHASRWWVILLFTLALYH